MRNWLTAFRPASFRGVRFKVDGEGMAGQRRLSISPIAYADRSVIEDMGRDPMVWPIVAYVSGDAADSEAKAFTSALSMRGAATLVLPMQGSVRARVQGFERDRRKDVGGHVAFSVTFIEEGLGAVPFGLLAGAGPIADLLAQGGAVIGAALAGSFAGLSAARQSPQNDDVALSAVRAMGIAAATIGGDAPAKLVSNACDALANIAPIGIDQPLAYGVALAGAWRAIALNNDPIELRAALATELRIAPLTPAGLAERSAMCGALAVTVVRRTYRARQDARAAREELGRVCDATLATVGPLLGDAVFAWLSQTTGDAAEALSATAASRAPLVRAETQLSLSAIAAAYQLYGDANRAQELVDRNRCATAAFMPISFEALAA